MTTKAEEAGVVEEEVVAEEVEAPEGMTEQEERVQGWQT